VLGCAPTQASLKRQPSRSSVRSHSHQIRNDTDAPVRVLKAYVVLGRSVSVIVLRGEPTLRTHEGEQQLREGDVVASLGKSR
jgi:hypothetical protein